MIEDDDETPEEETPAAEEVPAPDETPAAEATPAEEPPDETPAAEEPAAEEPPAEEPPGETPPAEEPAAEEPPAEEPPAEGPAAEEPAAAEPPAEEPAAEGPPAEEPAAAEPPAEEPVAHAAPEAEPAPESDAAEAEAEPPAAPARPKRERGAAKQDQPEVIPGAHLEPDLVLDEAGSAGDGVGERAGAEIAAAEDAFASDPDSDERAPDAPITTVLDLAAGARYRATGKRKSAVARVTLKPGTGVYTINGRELGQFFPRPTLQRIARGPLETVGHVDKMDVVATIHGGGVSGQAGALRHGVARALVEADPALRSELKRRGFLTRDPRVKERKKAGLKKARKRPQFSKR